jgi:hypothetical protein
MKKVIFFLILSWGLFQLQAQEPLSWKQLEGVSFDYEYREGENRWISKAKFSDAVKKWDGKFVQLKGHVLPLELDGGLVVLSAFPFSSCFFCGGAGPESVVELRFKKRRKRWKTDEVATFSGTLRLNNTEFEMIYILEDAQFVN